MEPKEILLWVLVGALVVLEAYKYLKRRAEGATVEDSAHVSFEALKDILENFNVTIRDMSANLRDSVSQETFNEALRLLDSSQERIKEGILFELSELLEDYIKRVDHDPSNDPVDTAPNN